MLELVAVTVEHINVGVTGNDTHLSVGCQLPDPQFHIRLILAVARYPYGIGAFDNCPREMMLPFPSTVFISFVQMVQALKSIMAKRLKVNTILLCSLSIA